MSSQESHSGVGLRPWASVTPRLPTATSASFSQWCSGSSVVLQGAAATVSGPASLFMVAVEVFMEK